MKIQFVCKGNSYRSRIAEAYLKSKNIPNLNVISSGIAAEDNLNGHISEYGFRVLSERGLAQYLSKTWRMTRKEDLERQDLVIFMESSIRDFCLDKLNCKLAHYETWNISDIPDEIATKRPINIEEIMPYAEEGFEKIKINIDVLIKSNFLA